MKNKRMTNPFVCIAKNYPFTVDME